jgi:hypothetical protein
MTTTRIDERLRDALSKDDAQFLKDLEDGRGLFTQLGATFQGPLAGWTAFGFVLVFAFIGLGVFSGFQLAATQDLGAVVLWASLLWLSFLSVGLIKLWIFMRMNHLVLLRAIKSLELRLAAGASA